jgi:hypothetical protein
MTMTCKECFDENLPARLLAERCDGVSVTLEREPVLKAIVSYRCRHSRLHRHSVYPDTEDWIWCEFATDDWRWCEVIPALDKAA